MFEGLNALLSVGGITGVPPQEETETVFESRVTAPFCAKALPARIALVSRVILVSARIFPTNFVPTCRVAELPTCQNTWHGEAPFTSNTVELVDVMRVLPILKIKTAFGFPWASRVRVPVNPAEEAKQ